MSRSSSQGSLGRCLDAILRSPAPPRLPDLGGPLMDIDRMLRRLILEDPSYAHSEAATAASGVTAIAENTPSLFPSGANEVPSAGSNSAQLLLAGPLYEYGDGSTCSSPGRGAYSAGGAVTSADVGSSAIGAESRATGSDPEVASRIADMLHTAVSETGMAGASPVATRLRSDTDADSESVLEDEAFENDVVHEALSVIDTTDERGRPSRSSGGLRPGRLWSPTSSAFSTSWLSEGSPVTRAVRREPAEFAVLDGALGAMLRRLTAESVLEEGSAASVRRALQLGAVMTGHRLTDEEIRVLPKVRFDDEEQQFCSICLEAYQQGQLLTALRCDHFFHVECLSSWMQRATQCPLCRQECGTAPKPLHAMEELYSLQDESAAMTIQEGDSHSDVHGTSSFSPDDFDGGASTRFAVASALGRLGGGSSVGSELS